jgi:multiple sugar transport system ATP-binding protein
MRGVHKFFGSFEAIKGVDLDVADHEFVVFVGPSGCGKTSLLRMIAGLEEISGGELLIDGMRSNDIGPADRGLAMVFQSYALYPHMTVGENMAFALRLAGVAKAERDRKVREAAAILQLERLLDRRPKELSGGQRQRVAIGRAIVRNPKIFLFDEPLSNLDAALRVQMRLELGGLHERLNATMIYVTHDQIEAMTMADKIVVMNAGEIEQVGSPLDLYRHPANVFVAGFIGSPRMNLLPARVTKAEASAVTVDLPDGAPTTVPVAANGVAVGDSVTVGVRPENLRISPDGSIAGRTMVAERLGSLTFFHVEIGGGHTVIVQTDGLDSTLVHDPVKLAIDQNACHLFASNGRALLRRAEAPGLHDKAPMTSPVAAPRI